MSTDPAFLRCGIALACLIVLLAGYPSRFGIAGVLIVTLGIVLTMRPASNPAKGEKNG